MARITIVRTDCKIQVSPNCSKVFDRPQRPGRPQVNCDACKAFKAPAAVGTEITKVCGCGENFTVRSGRGRKPSRCAKCVQEGTVYRVTDDDQIETVRKDALVRENQERKEANGRATAERLFALMGPLLRKTDRKVIVH